mmetsp:Transcript_18417/g.42953  ORF Transcript_18417/g.42953 Transcript_18417/m.42953 type:complete len:212 (+) Transcript_18417:3-638(+)
MEIWNNQRDSFPFSKLLSATSFELRDAPTFGEDINNNVSSNSNPYLFLPCVAVLPKDQGRLDFTLRTFLRPRFNVPVVASSSSSYSPGSTPQRPTQRRNALEFTTPDCRIDVEAALNNNDNAWTQNILPSVVWLPIGSVGILLRLIPRGHVIDSVQSVDGTCCQVTGRLALFATPTDVSGGLTSALQSFWNKRPLQPNPRGSNRQLPPQRK